uniref:uncharacterized protein n=1 Tax=Myxine glutinosa TaxID=7769 RepID=UPI00358F6BDF
MTERVQRNSSTAGSVNPCGMTESIRQRDQTCVRQNMKGRQGSTEYLTQVLEQIAKLNADLSSYQQELRRKSVHSPRPGSALSQHKDEGGHPRCIQNANGQNVTAKGVVVDHLGGHPRSPHSQPEDLLTSDITWERSLVGTASSHGPDHSSSSAQSATLGASSTAAISRSRYEDSFSGMKVGVPPPLPARGFHEQEVSVRVQGSSRIPLHIEEAVEDWTKAPPRDGEGKEGHALLLPTWAEKDVPRSPLLAYRFDRPARPTCRRPPSRWAHTHPAGPPEDTMPRDVATTIQLFWEAARSTVV